jgi:transcriptional regulatory protein RtcR
MAVRKTVVIGILGTTLDRGQGAQRWEQWRPTVSVCQHEDLLVHRFELLHDRSSAPLAQQVAEDMQSVSPETEVVRHELDFGDVWDFEKVYGCLADFTQQRKFDLKKEDYLVHITTGSHVAQICLFLLTESRHLPARLLQTAPPTRGRGMGRYAVIDLDLSKYDRLAVRHAEEQQQAQAALKSGIATKNKAFNQMITEIEQVAMSSPYPILLMGPTGAGKSQLARRVYELKQARHQLSGSFVEVNCATLRGDAAMSALFGHVKGAFTGAQQARTGLLRTADEGLLFLDEIGELGLDEQAMLLRALEDKRFLPVGADAEVKSDFQLIAGTNRDLSQAVREGRFRDDLLARINLWSFTLPGLAQRREDIEPNLDYELEKASARLGRRITMARDVRAAFLSFARSAEAKWVANFRDLNAAVTRMSTLATTGRISREILAGEEQRLRMAWIGASGAEGAAPQDEALLAEVLGPAALAQLDLFDQVQLAAVIRVCRSHEKASDAGRALYAISRTQRKVSNDADRLGKYLARFGLSWKKVQG